MKFKMGDKVRKISGGKWRGTVVGTYSTELNPEGYAVESASEVGSVQIYPAKALEAWDGEAEGYTAVDMATERAEGFRDGQAAVTAERDAANSRLHDVAVACATAEQERDQLRAGVEDLRKAMEKALGVASCALNQIGGIRHGSNVTSSELWASCEYLETLIAGMRAAMAAKEA